MAEDPLHRHSGLCDCPGWMHESHLLSSKVCCNPLWRSWGWLWGIEEWQCRNGFWRHRCLLLLSRNSTAQITHTWRFTDAPSAGVKCLGGGLMVVRDDAATADCSTGPDVSLHACSEADRDERDLMSSTFSVPGSPGSEKLLDLCSVNHFGLLWVVHAKPRNPHPKEGTSTISRLQVVGAQLPGSCAAGSCARTHNPGQPLTTLGCTRCAQIRRELSPNSRFQWLRSTTTRHSAPGRSTRSTTPQACTWATKRRLPKPDGRCFRGWGDKLRKTDMADEFCRSSGSTCCLVCNENHRSFRFRHLEAHG